MPETWPATLPRFFKADSYDEDEGDNLLETQDVAIPKSRPLSTNPAREVSGSMRFTLAQTAIFRAFGRVTLVNFSQPFWFPAHTGESDASNPGYWLVKFRKDGQPKYGLVSAAKQDVSFGLFILP